MAIVFSRVHEPREPTESDSAFVSAADFFSLISLSLIYVVIVVAGPAMPGTNAVTWVNTAQQASGAASGENLTFVVLVPDPEGVRFRVYREKTNLSTERLVHLTPGGQADVKEWLATILKNEPEQERVVFHLGTGEQPPEAHKLFNELLESTQEKYPTTQAFRKVEP